ncbi:MAG: hypothetical protein HOW73_24925 [Polyangiaceae bacterium]|nr:hypothetical protein [Polyangiaceae bacterium]
MAANSPHRPPSLREEGDSAEPERLKSDRIEAALTTALEGGSTKLLFDLLDRASGMPGPRPHTDVLRAFGARIAAEKGAGEEILAELLESKKTSLFYVGVMVLAERAIKSGEKRALGQLMDLAEDERKERRDAITDALVIVLAARSDEGARVVRPLADGYLHAYVALEALTNARVLEKLSESDSVLGLMSDAFASADEAPRAADRSQGLRLLRLGFPKQIARASVRFADTADWLKERLDWPRPDTREVVAEAIRGLRKVLGEAEADRLRIELEGNAKPPRDPSRIVKGTRKRSRGR